MLTSVVCPFGRNDTWMIDRVLYNHVRTWKAELWFESGFL